MRGNNDNPKILIVDTDGRNIEMLAQLLETENYIVRDTSGYQKSLTAVQNWKPDLVLLNILISTFNPFDFIAEIRKNPFIENQKILILSQNRKIDIVTGPSPRVKGYLNKPIDFEALKNMLKKTLDHSENNKPLTIMVADDDEEFCDLLKMFLESNSYKPLIINDAQKIIEAVKIEKPDLLLLDIMMPKKDGFQIMDELQDEVQTAKIPIIVLSALRLNNYQEKGMLTGLPEIISRELPKEIVLNAIKKCIGRDISPKIGQRTQTIKPRVLIADDQTELLFLMKETLEKSGFEVAAANDGKEALQMAFESHPDIAVLDYNMPQKDGLAVAEELKNNPLFAHVPIIILTAFSEKKTKMKGLSMGIDDYLIKPVDTDELIARIRMILKRNKQVLDTNPLSKLPGNPSIQARIEREIAKQSDFAVLYLDLDHFKSYNDAYGFEAGDLVLKTTANLLVKLTMQNENSEDFIGHIGGDDFIIITSFEKAEDLCKRITSSFDEISPSFYSKKDKEAGSIVSTDRQGNIQKYPFVSISIGVIHNRLRQLISFAQISNIGTDLKKKAKKETASSYVFDRRKD
ncbi:MAG: response regulator [Elusimicrobia bacterium]|nr:response regulator [Elusimicrobiota bacterium]